MLALVTLCAASFGVRSAPGGELAAAPDAPAAAPFPLYQALLDDHLVVTVPHPLETRFDYVKLHDNLGRFERLSRVRRELLAVSPAALAPAARRAWAINTYNFLVIEAVTHDLVSTRVSKYQMGDGWRGILNANVQQIRVEGVPLFQAPLVEIDGVAYSLDRFERTFVFDGWDLKSDAPRPAALDPRPHFALVCAAQGCPPLRPRAYRADSLDAQLDAAVREALAHPNQLKWSPETGQLGASAIFEWYAADFGGPERAFEFLVRYAPADVAPALAKREVKRIDRVLPWSWKLNYVPPATKPRPQETRGAEP